jgi:hypothetical protein
MHDSVDSAADRRDSRRRGGRDQGLGWLEDDNNALEKRFPGKTAHALRYRAV